NMHDPRVELDIAYHTDAAAPDDHRYHRAAQWIADRFQFHKLIVSVAIVDDPTIQEVNREHLDHDWPTDVVSFVIDQRDGVVEGEVIASHQTAERVHADAQWSVSDELLLYVVHGILHVAG